MAAALCYGSRGGGAALAFHHQPGAYDTDTLIQALGELRRALGGPPPSAASNGSGDTPHLAFSFLRHCGLSLW
jgi:hypothetical protein